MVDEYTHLAFDVFTQLKLFHTSVYLVLPPPAYYTTVVFGEVKGQVFCTVCTPVLLLWMVD